MYGTTAAAAALRRARRPCALPQRVFARKYLVEETGTRIRGYLAQIGEREFEVADLDHVDDNPFFCPEPGAGNEIAALIDQLRRDGDSIGAKVTVVASNVPVGLGEPVFGKLDADLASALVGINAVKGVEGSARASSRYASVAANIATSATAAASCPTTRAACSAA